MDASPENRTTAAALRAAAPRTGGGSLVYDPDCSCCKLLGRKWAPQIVAALLTGMRRFSELHAAIPGLSEKVLGIRLDQLATEGIVTRRQYPEIPARVEYALTERGRALEPVIREMACWSRRYETRPEPEVQP